MRWKRPIPDGASSKAIHFVVEWPVAVLGCMDSGRATGHSAAIPGDNAMALVGYLRAVDSDGLDETREHMLFLTRGSNSVTALGIARLWPSSAIVMRPWLS